MYHLKKIFLAAIVACITILGISFFAVRRHSTHHTATPLFHHNIQQLKELCYAKYRQSIRFMAYANHAMRDSLPATAALFHAMARADAIHLSNCRHAIEALGGRVSLPIITPTTFSHSVAHLENALSSKWQTHYDHMPAYITQALADNNRYVARMLTWCDACDAKQILLLRQILNDSVHHKYHFHVCPTCGDITWEEVRTRHCPQCMTESEKFFVIEPTAR